MRRAPHTASQPLDRFFHGRDNSTLVYLNWYSVAEVCCGDTRTLKGWSGTTFLLPNVPPVPPTNLQTDGTIFTRRGSPDVTWYQVWIGTISPLTTAYTNWHLAESLGCENTETGRRTPYRTAHTPGLCVG